MPASDLTAAEATLLDRATGLECDVLRPGSPADATIECPTGEGDQMLTLQSFVRAAAMRSAFDEVIAGADPAIAQFSHCQRDIGIDVLQINHQAAGPAMGIQPQAHEGHDVPGALPAVKRALFVDKIVEHVNDNQSCF